MEKEVIYTANDSIVTFENLYGVSTLEVIGNGARVTKTKAFVNDGLKSSYTFNAPASGTYKVKIVFSGLAAGEYTLYYLYDGWNLSEGMVTVTVK